MSKHVLISGACGFIGGHTVEHILKNTNWHVTVLDALTYAGEVFRLTDIDAYDPRRVDIYWHDLNAPIGERLIEQIGNVDYVINMASNSHVDRSISDPVPFVQNNVNLVLHMLEYARVVKPKIFVQVSTDEVYGPAPENYSHKEWDVILPSNPYSASKAAQEAIAFSYWRTYGVPVVITNTMNNFGERQHPEKFVPLVINKLLKKEVIQVHAGKANGKWIAGSRVWLHARNHADALLYILNGLKTPMYPEADRPLRLNVVGDTELTNEEMVLNIAKVLDCEPLYEMSDFHASRPGHDLRYSLDGSLLELYGWRPPVSFEQALEKTVGWYIK